MPKEQQNKFPTEVIDLPSGGKLYSPDSPIHNGKIEIKYMTAKEEDILTSQNLIKKGIVIDTLLNSLIITEGVKTDDLILGDKNAIMVAARILAYGPEYEVQVTNPIDGQVLTHEFNLADCPFKELPKDISYDNNEFEITLPVSKTNIVFKLLTGKEEKTIDREIKSRKRLGGNISSEMTTRLKNAIISVSGDDSKAVINDFVDNMLSKDSLYLRQEISRITPDIELKQEIEIGGEAVMVDVPMTATFFWPNPEA